jgi:glycosyltransferase involved in cell wall biosynthesis
MFIADDPQGFADGIARVLSDEPLRAAMRAAGYAFLESHHSIAAARARVEQAVGLE